MGLVTGVGGVIGCVGEVPSVSLVPTCALATLRVKESSLGGWDGVVIGAEGAGALVFSLRSLSAKAF